MAAEDPLTDGEIRRNIDRLDRAFQGLAKDMVTTAAWERENLHLKERIDEVDRDCIERTRTSTAAIEEIKRRAEQRSEWTWQRWIGVAGVIAAIAAALIGVAFASSGVH